MESELRAPKRGRRPGRVLTFLSALTVAAAIVGFALTMRSSKLEWYTSPPIDKQGHRVHLRVPVGWKKPDAKDETPNHGLSGVWLMVLNPDSAKPKPSLARTWMKKLGLIHDEAMNGIIVLQIGEHVTQAWDGPMDMPFKVDGKVYVLTKLGDQNEWMGRAVQVSGIKEQVAVVTSFDRKHNFDGVARIICQSMFVK